MSEKYYSPYDTDKGRFLSEYKNRTDGRKLVRELIQDLVEQRLNQLHYELERDELHSRAARWASEHPIALLKNEFSINIENHEEPID